MSKQSASIAITATLFAIVISVALLVTKTERLSRSKRLSPAHGPGVWSATRAPDNFTIVRPIVPPRAGLDP